MPRGTRGVDRRQVGEEPLAGHDRRRPSVTLRYRVYGREMTVRNNWIESAFAMLNGAPTFISLVGGARGRTKCASSCRLDGRRRRPR